MTLHKRNSIIGFILNVSLILLPVYARADGLSNLGEALFYAFLMKVFLAFDILFSIITAIRVLRKGPKGKHVSIFFCMVSNAVVVFWTWLILKQALNELKYHTYDADQGFTNICYVVEFLSLTFTTFFIYNFIILLRNKKQ